MVDEEVDPSCIVHGSTRRSTSCIVHGWLWGDEKVDVGSCMFFSTLRRSSHDQGDFSGLTLC